MEWGSPTIRRRLRIGTIILAIVALLALAAIAVFPFGLLKPGIEARLTKRFGRPVTIGSIERLDAFSFTPTIAIRDVHIPQQAWAGKGAFATLATARVRVEVLPLLLGHFRPKSILLDGLRLALVRDADGRKNWADKNDRGDGDDAPGLDGLIVTNTRISYRDAKQDRRFEFGFVADARGVRLAGTGVIHAVPVRIVASGPVVVAKRPWPFAATLAGDALAMSAKGTMDTPLDTGHMTLDMTARAADLKLIDAVIEAGLFGTQPVNIKARVRHDDPKWTITGLAGTIGRSDIAGHLDVDKQDGRTRLNGAVVSNGLDFDDLASNEGHARALALERAEGVKLVPGTRINIRKIDKTDGTIAVDIRRVLSGRRPSSITAVKGILSIDHQLLTVAPLTIRLKQGAITGTIRVDQRGGRPVPIVTIDLRLNGSSVGAIAGGGGSVTGSVAARAHLVGPGSTIREVVGKSDGSIGLVARDGGLPEKLAEALGFDAGALFAGNDDRAGLRCAVLRLDVRHGTGTADPLIVDTTDSQLHGVGTVRFPEEAIDLTLTGAPKGNVLLRLPGAAHLGGTIRAPDMMVPKQVKSVGNIFKAIGRAIKGTTGPQAADADCAALSARALGG